MLTAIHDALESLAAQHGVRVLLAVESGSRAWGFASPDSDYDVRLVYAHRPEWYLRVFDQRDVIEAQLPGDLDISGWELRKALRLLAKGNAPLAEWLGSPIVYRKEPGFGLELRQAMEAHFNPATILFQYLGQARRILDVDLASEPVPLKRIFYFLRPLFAARWVAESGSMAPTPFAELLAAPWSTSEERNWVQELLARKSRASEGETTSLPADRRRWMREQLALLEGIGPSLARKSEAPPEMLDRLLGRWLAVG